MEGSRPVTDPPQGDAASGTSLLLPSLTVPRPSWPSTNPLIQSVPGSDLLPRGNSVFLGLTQPLSGEADAAPGRAGFVGWMSTSLCFYPQDYMLLTVPEE